MRAYTVTTGVWARGILATEYGVDLSKVTWVLADEEHVEEYHRAYPANVVYQAGANLAEMVARSLAAADVDNVDSQDVKPLIANARQAEAAWYQKTGIYPINHGGGQGRAAAGRPHPGTTAATLLQRRRSVFAQLALMPPSPTKTRPWHSCAAWWGLIHYRMVWRATVRPWRR